MKRYGILSILVTSLGLLPSVAFAHVGYVIDPETLAATHGFDLSFFVRALSAQDIALILTGFAVSLLLFVVAQRSALLTRIASHSAKHASSYQDLVPWMVRLALGIALIGAGSSHTLISPVLQWDGLLGTAQIALGFMLLLGFGIRYAALGSVMLYLFGLTQSSYLLGNLDLLGLGVLLFLLPGARPGVDDMFEIPQLQFSKLSRYAPLVARVGLGFSMAYLAVLEKVLNPHWSEAVVQRYHLQSAVPVSAELWVLGAGLIELAVGLAILLGYRVRLFAAVAFGVLSVSFFFFNESVYSHVTLFATLSIIYILGSGKKN